jgi:hypothetical protein
MDTNSNFQLFNSLGGFGYAGVQINSVDDTNNNMNALVFNASRHIFANGNVGIGTPNPQYTLTLYSNTANAPRSIATQAALAGTNSYGDGEFMADKTVLSVRSYSSAFNAFSHVAGLSLANMSEIWADQIVAESNAGLLIGTGSRSTTPLPPLIFATQSTERMRISGDGNVTIKAPTSGYSLDVTGTVHASGDITSSGSIQANYQDVAEWVAASEPLAPGTVVVLNPDQHDEVTASATAYDTSVAGVVSERPGIVLGKAAPNKAQIATTGRVKVRVDASHAPIKIGDLLVTSDVRGAAMKSEPMEINGRRFHQPGTIIGKALEPLASGDGEILVLLSLQ